MITADMVIAFSLLICLLFRYDYDGCYCYENSILMFLLRAIIIMATLFALCVIIMIRIIVIRQIFVITMDI